MFRLEGKCIIPLRISLLHLHLHLTRIIRLKNIRGKINNEGVFYYLPNLMMFEKLTVKYIEQQHTIDDKFY